jgi:hypothetical protein
MFRDVSHWRSFGRLLSMRAPPRLRFEVICFWESHVAKDGIGGPTTPCGNLDSMQPLTDDIKWECVTNTEGASPLDRPESRKMVLHPTLVNVTF